MTNPIKERHEKIRLDKLLVDHGHAASRERAQALILAGRVLVDEQRIDKPGTASPPAQPSVSSAPTSSTSAAAASSLSTPSPTGPSTSPASPASI